MRRHDCGGFALLSVLVVAVALFALAAVATSINVRLHAWNRRALARLAERASQVGVKP